MSAHSHEGLLVVIYRIIRRKQVTMILELPEQPGNSLTLAQAVDALAREDGRYASLREDYEASIGDTDLAETSWSEVNLWMHKEKSTARGGGPPEVVVSFFKKNTRGA